MALENVVASLVLDVINHDQAQAVVKSIALDSKTRFVRATIVQDGLDYSVDESATVTLTILRPDNVGVQVTGSVVDVDNADRTGTIKGVYAELTQAALAKSGTLRAQFKVTSGEQILRTEIFQVKNGIALDGETSEWADQYQGYDLDELVQSVNSAVAAITEIETDVSELKSGLTRLDDLSLNIENNGMPVGWFERGSISSGANDTYRSGSRARTKNMLRFDSMIAVTVTSGYFLIAYYDANNTWTSNSGWKTSTDTIAISKNQNFRIVVSLNNSAPESQTDALADMVGILVFKTDATENRIKNVLNMEFEHGSLNNGANDTYNQNARCRTVGICQFPFDVDVSMKSGSYVIHFLDESGIYTNKTTWRTTEKYRISAYTKFRLLLTNNATSNVYADLSDMVENLDIEILQSNVPTSACPNIIFQCRNVDEDHIPTESKWYVKEAARNQYDRVRFTYRKTSDGYYFNCHDDVINNVARNMDGTEISTSVSSNGQTLATLNSYDWGIKYGSKYAGATVPLLEDGMKYAAIFNLGVTLHSSTALYETDEDVQNLLAMTDKYGLTDNLIVITGNGHNFVTMQKYLAHNPRISFYVGGELSFFEDSANINAIKALQTPYNKIYVQLYPWGTVPTSDFIALSKTNNFVLYNSTTMLESDLLNLNAFNKGYGLIEVNNVYRIKDTVRNWANSLIN